jgi:aspartate/methionine/tyrosine aminotransferase
MVDVFSQILFACGWLVGWLVGDSLLMNPSSIKKANSNNSHLQQRIPFTSDH